MSDPPRRCWPEPARHSGHWSAGCRWRRAGPARSRTPRHPLAGSAGAGIQLDVPHRVTRKAVAHQRGAGGVERGTGQAALSASLQPNSTTARPLVPNEVTGAPLLFSRRSMTLAPSGRGSVVVPSVIGAPPLLSAALTATIRSPLASSTIPDDCSSPVDVVLAPSFGKIDVDRDEAAGAERRIRRAVRIEAADHRLAVDGGRAGVPRDIDLAAGGEDHAAQVVGPGGRHVRRDLQLAAGRRRGRGRRGAVVTAAACGSQ